MVGNDDEPGIIPLAIEEVFAFIEEVSLSLLEAAQPLTSHCVGRRTNVHASSDLSGDLQ